MPHLNWDPRVALDGNVDFTPLGPDLQFLESIGDSCKFCLLNISFCSFSPPLLLECNSSLSLTFKERCSCKKQINPKTVLLSENEKQNYCMEKMCLRMYLLRLPIFTYTNQLPSVCRRNHAGQMICVVGVPFHLEKTKAIL